MRQLRVIAAAAAILAGAMQAATGQEFTWSLDLGSVFDNREGDNKYSDTKTFFFTNLAPEIGVKFTDTDRIAGGVVWNQPIGNEWDGAKVSPTLYYRHHGKRWSASLGMFPRTQLHQELPGFLWCDSLTYFQHNIRGVLLQYDSDRSFIDFYLDWRQMQTETKREQFNIVFHGETHPTGRAFLVGGHVMMNHYALTKNAPDDQHIVDNFLVNPYVGFDWSRHTALDSLTVKVGALMTIERNRGNDRGWQTPAGGWIEALGEWKWLGVKNSLYVGRRLYPSYSEFGSTLYQGEPYYQSKFYNRTDVYAKIYTNRWVDLQASLDFNVMQGSFIFYQRLMVRVNLDYLNCRLFRKK